MARARQSVDGLTKAPNRLITRWVWWQQNNPAGPSGSPHYARPDPPASQPQSKARDTAKLQV